MITWARIFQGLWQGSANVLTQAYVAECLPKEENTVLVNRLIMAQILGVGLGPLCGIILSYVNFSVNFIMTFTFNFRLGV